MENMCTIIIAASRPWTRYCTGFLQQLHSFRKKKMSKNTRTFVVSQSLKDQNATNCAQVQLWVGGLNPSHIGQPFGQSSQARQFCIIWCPGQMIMRHLGHCLPPSMITSFCVSILALVGVPRIIYIVDPNRCTFTRAPKYSKASQNAPKMLTLTQNMLGCSASTHTDKWYRHFRPVL